MTRETLEGRPLHTTYEWNQTTQPLVSHPVFANWKSVAKAWFYVMPSKELKRGEVKSFSLAGQRLVLFRGEDGKVRALDAFCPHMGADLAIGKVRGNHIQCFFHHWTYAGNGACVDIPCLRGKSESAPKVQLASYEVIEKFSCLWIWPDAKADMPFPDFPEPLGDNPVVLFGKSILRTCHHHVCMINGLDPQHLKTVHQIGIDMEVSTEIREQGQLADFLVQGKFPDSRIGKILQFLFGSHYSYAMRYVTGSVGLLTTLRGLRFRGRGFFWPQSTMIFAYRPVLEGKTFIQPIFITKRRAGPLGWLMSRIMLLVAAGGFYLLRDEDGAVYDNIRFQPRHLLSIDGPILQFIQYINKLNLSKWSAPDHGDRSRPES
jgi:phenylpropionate dioxygenase-like ring-hydroxylating dioxygenase large terminal subunit